MSWRDAIEAVRKAPFDAATGAPDVRSLAEPVLADWLYEVDDALARLLMVGLAHPDADLAPRFELLALRAQELGSEHAWRALNALAVLTSALVPGPPDPTERRTVSAHLWREQMLLHSWLRWFRAEVALATAEAVSVGAAPVRERQDLPRFSGRVWLDGLTVDATTVHLHGHTEAGEAVLLVDRVARLDADDPCRKPLISRLFHDELVLAELLDHVVEIERHPFGRKGALRVLRPSSRSRPHLRSADTRSRGPQIREGTASVRWVRGEVGVSLGTTPLDVGGALELNLLKRLAAEGRSSCELPVWWVERRAGPILVGTPDRKLVHVDPSVDPLVPEDLLPEASGWLRTVLGGPLASRGDWRAVWWAERSGVSPRDPRTTGVWLALWRGEDVSGEPLPELGGDPSLTTVAERALLLDAHGRGEEARDLVAAHVEHTRKRDVLPPSADLLLLADVAAWLSGADRSGAVGEALELPADRMRSRLARQLLEWRTTGEGAERLADTVALARVSRWGRAVLAF